MIEIIRDRVFRELARAVGDERAAADPSMCDLISLGEHAGEEVFLTISVEVDLEVEIDGKLERVDVVDGLPPASRDSIRKAHAWTSKYLGERFLLGYQALPPPPITEDHPYQARKHPLQVIYPGPTDLPQDRWMPIVFKTRDDALVLAQHLIQSNLAAAKLDASYAELRIGVALPEWHALNRLEIETQASVELSQVLARRNQTFQGVVRSVIGWLDEVEEQFDDSVVGLRVNALLDCAEELGAVIENDEIAFKVNQLRNLPPADERVSEVKTDGTVVTADGAEHPLQDPPPRFQDGEAGGHSVDDCGSIPPSPHTPRG